jgi:hypothetical protein
MRLSLLAWGLMLVACGSRTPMDDAYFMAGPTGGGILPDGGRSGGSPGTGGAYGSGGAYGTGGSYGTGGDYGAGGGYGTGGAYGSGGSYGTGGDVGVAGSYGTGGYASGGSFGSGGSVGMGGGGIAGGAGYPIAKPGEGLVDILPGVNPTPRCERCVREQCPAAIACSNDPACAAGFSCIFAECPGSARRRRGPSLECLATCFGGDITPAIGGAQGIQCVYDTCSDQCVAFGGGRGGGGR